MSLSLIHIFTEKAERSIRAGHPWVYDTELLAGEAPDGALADVMSRKGRWLGTRCV